MGSGVVGWLGQWPVYRQLRDGDPLGRGKAVRSPTTDGLRPRIRTADKVVKSICPYCAVGCGQNVYVKDEKVVQIEGDPDSPVSRGRLCPKGSASLQLTTGSARERPVVYRPPERPDWGTPGPETPEGADWERLALDTAMEMIADRLIQPRRQSWEWESDGKAPRRTLGITHLGG